MTEPIETEPDSRVRVMLRWALLAIGIAAILVFATTQTGVSIRPGQPGQTASAPQAADPVEPAPLTFQPNIAPADAEAMNAMRADYQGPIVAAKPLIAPRTFERQPDLQRAVDCLTQAVYYEAATESAEGQRAVAQVVINRVRDPRYPSSVCGVVYQGSERRTGCQFTFTCDGALARKPDPFLFARARMVAVAALSGRVESLVGLATHYHTKQVVPYWRTDLVKLRTVGAHIFYGWQGREKSGRGLREGYAGIEPVIAPSPFASGLTPDILPTTDELENGSSPFAAPVPESPMMGPKLPAQDYGGLRADESKGELAIGQSGGLEADNKSGVLARP
jgi:spore germination cell wall hydrolase CwlJ-like protein